MGAAQGTSLASTSVVVARSASGDSSVVASGCAWIGSDASGAGRPGTVVATGTAAFGATFSELATSGCGRSELGLVNTATAPPPIAARAASPSAYASQGVTPRAAARGGSTGVMNDGGSRRSTTVTAAARATTGGAGAAATAWSINGCCGGSDGDTEGRPKHAAIASAASAPD